MQNKKGLNQVLQADEYRYPALVPPMPWHDMTPPAAPKNLSADGKAHLVMLSWETVYSDNLMYYLVYRFAKGQAVDLNDPSAIVAKVLYDHDARKVLPGSGGGCRRIHVCRYRPLAQQRGEHSGERRPSK